MCSIDEVLFSFFRNTRKAKCLNRTASLARVSVSVGTKKTAKSNTTTASPRRRRREIPSRVEPASSLEISDSLSEQRARSHTRPFLGWNQLTFGLAQSEGATDLSRPFARSVTPPELGRSAAAADRGPALVRGRVEERRAVRGADEPRHPRAPSLLHPPLPTRFGRVFANRCMILPRGFFIPKSGGRKGRRATTLGWCSRMTRTVLELRMTCPKV